jgi:cytochrome b561
MVTVLVASTAFEPDLKKEFPPAPAQSQVQAPAPESAPAGIDEDDDDRPKFDFSKLPVEQRVAFGLRNKVWDTHKIIGFGLCILLLSRMIIEVRTQKEGRLLSKIHYALNFKSGDKNGPTDKQHFLLVKRGYLVFYLLILVMACTGLIMAFEHTAPLKSMQRPAREIHEFFQYLVYAYVLFHLAGVIRADMTRQKGIVSAMINGGEK